MVLVSLFERERTRDRARVRPNAPGNFITDQRRATVFGLTFSPTPEHYIHWWPYIFPESKAIGYIDNPPLSPPWEVIGVDVVSTQVPNITGGILPGGPGSPPAPITIPGFDPTPITPGTFLNQTPIGVEVIDPPPLGPSNIPEGASVVIEGAHRAGEMFNFIPGVVPRQVISSEFPITHLTVLADDANGAPIWIGYTPGVAVGEGFKLIPGSAKDLQIDDFSDLWIVAENGTDQVFMEYTT